MPPGSPDHGSGERRPLVHTHLGLTRYLDSLTLQLDLAQALRSGREEAKERLLTVEHEPVITVGRRGREEDVLIPSERRIRLGVDLQRVDRGGEVTYHGPGQLVCYPILKLDPLRVKVADLVRNLAQALIDLLQEWRIDALYDPRRPGLWVKGSKIGAIGMRVSGGVTSHGAALNVINDLEPFGWIVPCGLKGCAMTSMAQELGGMGGKLDLQSLAERFAHLFADRLGYRLEGKG
ncbi:MAG: lipoyl(octanoyl) transferase LipB [Bradymonadales bacterium]|nr:lipoyl(octanoyl) transferase LipB [Bradymonadales bacterium]